MRGKVLALVCALSFSLPTAGPAQDLRIPLCVRGGGTAGGFTDPSKDRRDSANDLRKKLAEDSPSIRLVESETDAVIVLEVLGRETRREINGWAMLNGQGQNKSWLTVRLSAGEYSTEFSADGGSSGVMTGYGKAAGKIAKQVESWVQANRALLTEAWARLTAPSNPAALIATQAIDPNERQGWPGGFVAQPGDAVEMYNLGVTYANAVGSSRNDGQMIACFRKAADQGYAPAQFALGVLHTKGEAIPQDLAQATGWNLKAADQGYAPAQSNLSVAYANGDGVPQDYVQAYKWATLAASSASGDALKKYTKNRDFIIRRLTPAQLAEGEKLVQEWLKAFAEREKDLKRVM